LLATKAIQTKPTGEPRTPTPSWSGLGFSNSMPESIIRENLELNDLDGAAGCGEEIKYFTINNFLSLLYFFRLFVQAAERYNFSQLNECT